MLTVDFAVIGGGIAGVAAAAHLAPHGDVLLLEREASLAFHTTGRSAAVFIVNYGGTGSRPLARASRTFFEDPPEYSVDSPLLSPRGAIWVATPSLIPELEAVEAAGRRSGAGSERIGPSEVVELVPFMRPDRLGGGLYEPSARDIDVAGLHQALVRIIRNHGGEIHTSRGVESIDRQHGNWRIKTTAGEYQAASVVNAAGAWGDQVAEAAGVDPIGLQPMRRTAFMVPGSDEYAELPMVVSVGNDYYLRPDGTQLLCSLAEETPSEPGDPRPRMEDVALAIERINEVTTLGIRTVNSQWTGLRTFAPDRDLVIGEEPTAPGFFWLVGQGGTGIMCAPGYGQLIASQVLGTDLPQSLTDAGVDPAITSPDRFR